MTRRFLPCIFFAFVWIGCFWFFSQDNQFSIFYHPDESSKGEQVVSGDLNFHHPLLLLDSIRVYLGIKQESPTIENAVLAGRAVSAIFSAFTVVALSILAGRRAGPWAALLAAVIIPLHPLIYELSHYCKEDPALLLGLSLSFLALDIFWERPGIGPALFLGASAGLAVSGKYLGVVMLLATLPLLLWKIRQQKMKPGIHLAAFLGAFFVVVFVINLPYFLQPSALQSGLSYEIHAASIGGKKGLSREVPHGKYIGIFEDNIGWPLWWGVLCFAIHCFSRNNRRKAVDVFLLVFPLVYTLLLSFSPKTASRYFLAVAPFLILAGCLGFMVVKDWLARFPQWLRIGLPLSMALGASYVQMDLMQKSMQGFRTDSRREMAKWIAANLPDGSQLAAESRIQLSRRETWPKDIQPFTRIREQLFLPDFGPLNELSGLNIRYVAIIRNSFGGFMDEKRKPTKSMEDQHQHRSEFYHELFQKGKLLKKTGGSGVGIINPEIRLYELPQSSAGAL